jgi:BirA family biotin operon repressor/biotin-[acetyl-CoA-carboxylase] ligase
MAPSQKQLLAFVHGLPPHAEEFISDDITGPYSLFGECEFAPVVLSCLGGERDKCGAASVGKKNSLLVLWEDSEGASSLAAAQRVLDYGATNFPLFLPPSPLDLGIPASTYIAGRCTSTFNLAWQLLADGLLPEWGAVLCSCQTEGRGQLRRRWHSPRGNLYVTFRLPQDANLRGDAASLVVGGLVARAFEKLGFFLFLKWPNDLLLATNGKVGGILLEEKHGTVLAGLGVNLTESPSAALLRADNATSGAVLLPCHASGVSSDIVSYKVGITGFAQREDWKNYFRQGQEEKVNDCKTPERLIPFVLWRHLVSAVILEYTRTVAGQKLSNILVEFERLLAWKGRHVILTEAGGSACSGYCQGIGPTGGLLLRYTDGSLHEFFSGSLSLA